MNIQQEVIEPHSLGIYRKVTKTLSTCLLTCSPLSNPPLLIVPSPPFAKEPYAAARIQSLKNVAPSRPDHVLLLPIRGKYAQRKALTTTSALTLTPVGNFFECLPRMLLLGARITLNASGKLREHGRGFRGN